MRTYLHLPKGLQDLQTTLAAHEDTKKLAKPCHWIGILYFIDYLRTKRYNDKRYAADDYLPASRNVLQQYMGRETSQILDLLISNGIVECDGKRVYDVKPYGYRLTEEYRHDPTVTFKVSGKTVLERKLIERDGLSDAVLYQTQCLQSTGIRLWEIANEYPQVEGLAEWCATLPQDWRPNLSAEQFDAFRSFLWTVQDARAQQHLLMAFRFWSGDFVLSQDAYGRVHSNASNLPKNLRKYLVISGHQDLVNLDITASQVVLPLNRLLQRFPKAGQPADVLAWRRMVTSADPYLALFELEQDITLTEAERAEWVQKHRDSYKEKFFAFWYGRVQTHKGRSTVVKMMEQRFPNVLAWVAEEKQKAYESFSHRNQRQESDLVVQNMGRFCERNKVPFLSIHDSLLVPRKYARKVKTELEKQIFKLTGTWETRIKEE